MDDLYKITIKFTIFFLAAISLALFFGATPSLAQLTARPFIEGGNVAPPQFIRRGFVAVYDTSYKERKGQKEEVSTNIAIFLVIYSDSARTVTRHFLISNFSSLISTHDYNDVGGSGAFFINPSLLISAQKNPPPGVEVNGKMVHFKTNDTDSVTVFDEKGLVKSWSITTRSANKVQRSIFLLKWHGYVNLPSLPANFPPIARTAHYYVVSTTMPTWNGAIQETPFGQVYVQPGAAFGKVMEFSQQFLGNKPTGFPNSEKLFGTTFQGPFYMHPDFLSSLKPGMTILSIPAAGLSWKVTSVDVTSVRIDLYKNYRSAVYSVYDKSSGLMKMEVASTGDNIGPIIYRLAK